MKLKKYSLELAKKVNESGFVPQHILYVERGGLFVAHQVAKFFNCNISGIFASRSGTSVKSKSKVFFTYLPRVITHILRKIELSSNIHSFKKERNVYIERQFPPKDKKMLIVDDAIDTGYSLESVLSFLVANGYNRRLIKIAVLTTTGKNPRVHADIFLFEGVALAFPWSFDSNEYKQAWQLYSKIRSSINNAKCKLQATKIE